MARPKSDIEPRIVEAARERFLQDGVDGASLRMIARDAGTNIGMIYYYFPTKDDLFMAVVGEVYDQLVDDWQRALAADAPVRERIERLFRTIGEMPEEQFQVLRLVVREGLTSFSRLEPLIERTRLRHFTLVLNTLADGVADGSIDRSKNLAVMTMLTTAVGMAPQVMLHVAGDRLPFTGVPDRERLAEHLADILFDGIGGAQPATGDD